MKTLVLTGGGTAGHINPNIALIPYLKDYFDKIIYIGSTNGMEQKLLQPFTFIEYYPITTTKLKRSFAISNLQIPYHLFKGKKQAENILKNHPNCIIFSKGGFVSLPVVLAGNKLNIPMIAHESDLTMGLANKLTKNKYKIICTTFKETANKLKNGIYVGSPINDNLKNGDIDKARKMFNLSINKPVVTIIGGSQGSTRINNIIRQCIPEITKTHQIIHITGANKLDQTIKQKDYHQIEFVNNLADILSITDLAITRGGSNMLHELLISRIPMLIIPLSKGSRGDQVQNAKYFESKGYAIQLDENKLNHDTFINAWNTLKKRSNIIRSSSLNATPTNATERIAKEIIKLSKFTENTR